jgi:hypothetical protein
MHYKPGFVLVLASLLGLSFCSLTPRVKTEPDVVFVTTPHRVVREMLKLAHVKKDDILYDLGSGDGRIVIAAARDFGARAVGIEIDEKLVAESTENARRANVADRASFRKEDIFKADIHEATVVTLFLLPGVNQMLIPKLHKELRPGTRIVSHSFDMAEWKPDAVLTGYGSNVYFWYIPAEVGGDWNITIEQGKNTWQYIWRFSQAFQVVLGMDPKKNVAFKDVKLYGVDIEMVVENNNIGVGSLMELDGRVDGDTMEGIVRVKGGPSAGEYPWKGVRVKKQM